MVMHLIAVAYRRQPSMLPKFQPINNHLFKSLSTVTAKSPPLERFNATSFWNPQSISPDSTAVYSNHLRILGIQNGGNGSSFLKERLFSSLAEASDSPHVKLYQYHICPFCNITKSLMAYSKLNYDPVEVNPLTKAELKPWWVVGIMLLICRFVSTVSFIT